MEENKEKIGFNSDVDIPKEKRKYDKRTKIRKHTTRLMVLSTLVVLGSFSYMFAKVFSILFIIFLFFLIVTIIFLPIIFTLGLVLVSNEFRGWVQDVWKTFEYIEDLGQNLDKISPMYIYVGYASIGIALFTLMIAIIGRIREKKGYIGSIIYTVILAIISIALMILYVINGNSILI
ncbi:MAG: hypothetical protein IKP12_03775 [Acholeplasmatales bacterium]|nr:hypothetical protein [Acholeplasmatales bacterium]